MLKVSIVIPAFNAMSFLPETLKNVSEQTFQSYEVIIVNDGSSDNIETWMAQITDPRVKLISQNNQGASVARNTGIVQAQGEYIAFLDADDLWEPTKLEKQVQILDQDPKIGWVYTEVALIDSQGRLTGKVCKHDAEGDVWERLVEHNIIECGSTVMARRCCFETVGLFDANISPKSCGSEDWNMWLRIAEQYCIKVVPEVLTYYRSHPDNGSQSWIIMEHDYPLILEKAFANAPAHRQHLKSRSYSLAYIRIAWKALQNMNGLCDVTVSYRKKALASDPAIRYSKEYLHLSLALFLVQSFGLNRYKQFRKLVYRLKDSFLKFPKQLLSTYK